MLDPAGLVAQAVPLGLHRGDKSFPPVREIADRLLAIGGEDQRTAREARHSARIARAVSLSGTAC
jgi:hypothetical protein